LIRSDVGLRRRTGLALDGSIFDDQHALRLLAVDGDGLSDPFLWGLREYGKRTSQQTDDK